MDTMEKEVDSPPSPMEYVLGLVLVIALCVGFLFWRRTRGSESFSMETLSNSRSGVRLSTEEGPTAESFLNNDSTESLPLYAEHDVPVLPQAALEADAVAATSGRIATQQEYSDHPAGDPLGDPLGVQRESKDRKDKTDKRDRAGESSDESDDESRRVFTLDDDDD